MIKEDIEGIVRDVKKLSEKIKDKTFLVTGGAGFLGSWFCDVLNEFNANIICLDNLISGSFKNIEHLMNRKNFKFIKKDVCNFTITDRLDYIVHMASIASPSVYNEYPIQTLDANVIGTRNMLELARKNDVQAFLFTSTSEIYGNPPNNMIPTPENYYGFVNPFGPRSMYDEGKRVAETYCYSYFQKFRLPIRIARIFNTFGPRLDINSTSQYGRAVVKFINLALNNKPLEIWGDGKQTRSFCYITDQIEGLFRLLLTPNINGEILNIGNDKEITILELASKIIELANSKSKIKFSSGPEFMKDDPRRRCPALDKARTIIGFQPKVGLEDGLRRTIEWFRVPFKT